MKKSSLTLWTPSVVALLPLLLAGCALDPIDKKSTEPVPSGWEAGKAGENAAVSPTWWKEFGDAGLDKAIELALANSPDMESAYAQVRAARAAAGLADSGFWPTLGTNASYSRNHYSENILSNSSRGRTTGNYTVGGALAYEVDLWGRVSNESDAALAEYRASHAALERARQLLAAEIVRLWFNLAQSKVERGIVADELASRERTLELIRARDEAGMIAEDDVERAALDTARTRADLNELDRTIAEYRNALVASVGSRATPEPIGVMPEKIPTTPVAVPSAVVRSRPDIAVADLRLDAALLREGVARANYYPNVTLSATGGFTSINAGDFLSKSSAFWSFGPTVSLPIFTGGKNDAQLEASRARFDAATADYRRSVLNAFRDTENALVDVARLTDQEKYLASVDTAAERVYAFSKARFEGGMTSNLSVIIAERDALSARRDTVKVRFDRLRAAARLAVTLGGGWGREAGIGKSAEAFEARMEARENEAKPASTVPSR